MKTAWIFPGGSARAVYTAGVIYALSKMNVRKPDMIIAASGSAPTSVCYITGQYEIISKVWLESLSTRKFVSFWRFWNILNTNFLIDTVLKERNPLDMSKLSHSQILAYFPLTDTKSGKIEYFSNKMDVDLWEVMRASVSVPFSTSLFSLTGVKINGRFFSDSSSSSRFQLHVKKAISEGMGRIIVFDNWHDSDNPMGFSRGKAFVYMRGREFKKNQLAYFKEIDNFSIPDNTEFIKMSPKEKLGMGRFEINNENARKIFKRGYEDTFGDEKLKGILEN